MRTKEEILKLLEPIEKLIIDHAIKSTQVRILIKDETLERISTTSNLDKYFITDVISRVIRHGGIINIKGLELKDLGFISYPELPKRVIEIYERLKNELKEIEKADKRKYYDGQQSNKN